MKDESSKGRSLSLKIVGLMPQVFSSTTILVYALDIPVRWISIYLGYLISFHMFSRIMFVCDLVSYKAQDPSRAHDLQIYFLEHKEG